MNEYKCISCGAVKESENACSCPVCGYKMFEVPYERAEVLRKEIISFVSHLRLSEISKESLNVFRRVLKKTKNNADNDYEIIKKETDDQRFPGFSKIQEYVCSSAKTEIFFERIGVSLEQIRKHIHEKFEQNYRVTLERIITETEKLDEILRQALTDLGVAEEIDDIKLPECTLDYCVAPDDKLLIIADKLLDDLCTLSDKIRKFIKQNNIYGTAYQKKQRNAYKPSEEKDYAGDLSRCVSHVSEIISKQYSVDIFSDGSDELGEMLRAFWGAVEAIMTVPVLVEKYTYCFPDGMTATENNITSVLLDQLTKRYRKIDDAIFAPGFLAEKTEDELFDIYNKMIEIDSLGLMGINKHNLLKIGESEKKLNELIGLSEVKESIKKIKAYALANKDSEDLNIHMCFLGNPGSGKTEVARYIAEILYENKILPSKKLVEVDRSGLVSEYFGATAQKTSGVIASAMGGVLFVDEAYALGNNSDAGFTDYGKEAIDTLVKAMEDYRGKFCVIFAGYKNEMTKMLSINPGLKSRIQFSLDFPNYTRDELKSITELMLKKRKYTISDAAMSRILDITDVKRKDPNFANAREIRNILDQVIMCQNIRCVGTDDKELGLVDVNKYIQDSKIKLPIAGNDSEKRILTGEEELDNLIGLSSVKTMIKKIKAYAKRNKNESDFNLHMCFYGNPGTGKTEVARILSRILYDAGVLEESKLVETDGQGLIGRYVGETAPKTEAKINEAMNGVLFIDEAYSIAGVNQPDNGTSSYGDEAIAVLLKEMEDHRGQFCVILAGYKNEMKQMLGKNPGFESRIQFTLDFPNYTREELGNIAKTILAKKKYEITDDALEKVLDITDCFRKQPNFANARTVRNVLDQVIMNQNLRTEDAEEDNTVISEDVETYIIEKGINTKSPNGEKNKIGFA